MMPRKLSTVVSQRVASRRHCLSPRVTKECCGPGRGGRSSESRSAAGQNSE